MASEELVRLWEKIEGDLLRARGVLPAGVADDSLVKDFHEYLDHNELELACDMLEASAEEHSPPHLFWEALRDAALNMNLHGRAQRYAAMAGRP